jgi:TonB family protein
MTMTIARAALLLFLVSVSTLLFAQSDPRVTDAEDKYIRPILLVVPDIPKRDTADKLSIEIRVSGTVSDLGVLDSAEFSPSEGNEKYISAIKEVLPYWRFRPAVDDKLCAPVASSGVILVWFEEKDGKPSVSVSVPKSSSERETNKPAVSASRVTFKVRPKVDYPSDARRVGMEGSAELLFQVNPQGEVIQTKLRYSIPNKIFGDEAIRGARRAQFSLSAAGDVPEKNLCIVLPISFCLQSLATYPSQACLK